MKAICDDEQKPRAFGPGLLRCVRSHRKRCAAPSNCGPALSGKRTLRRPAVVRCYPVNEALCRRLVFQMFYTEGNEECHIEHLDKAGQECSACSRNPAFEQRQQDQADGIISQKSCRESGHPRHHRDIGGKADISSFKYPAEQEADVPADTLEGVVGHFGTVYQQFSRGVTAS